MPESSPCPPPPPHAPRRLAVLLDGTWNHPDQQDRGLTKPSNVTKLARAIRPIAPDGRSQLVYYDEGVGTHWGLDRWAGGGFGVGVEKNIREAYRFLVYNYAPGDEIFLFGFSRGAWTVRSLAGFIERVGLLAKPDAFWLNAAFDLYRRRRTPQDIAQFLVGKTCHRPDIAFIGVWDTVGSIGLPSRLFHALTRQRWNYHDVELAPGVRAAFHALAIDERRRPFRPTLWSGPHAPGQRVEQRWFAGVHSNIGGGYARDGLANCALHWIAGNAQAHGLELDREFLKPYRPFFGHEMRRTFSGAYRLLGPAQRPIGLTPTETIDRSVYQRWLDRSGVLARQPGSAPYRPPNLADYLRRHGLDAAAEEARLRAASHEGADARDEAGG